MADDAEGDMPVPAQPIEEPAPQPVVSPLTQAAVFLVLTISPGGEDTVRDLLPDLSGLGRSVGFRIPEGSLQVVTAIGSDALRRRSAMPIKPELIDLVLGEASPHAQPVQRQPTAAPRDDARTVEPPEPW